jgi:uncharacterized protein
LPPNMVWRTPAIDAAIDASDVFVFEAPLDAGGKAQIADFVRAHGMLPAGKTLPSLLNARALQDYRSALAATGLPPERLDTMRPWLASIALEAAYMEKQNYSPANGVDQQVLAIATAHRKSVRCFETVDQQLSLLAPPDRDLEVKEFDVDLHEFHSEMESLGPLVDAWASGDAAQVGRLMNEDLDHEPKVRKALLDDRNAAWMKELVPMLGEHHIYFITVGAGHLIGRHGLPALLQAKGFRVDGP